VGRRLLGVGPQREDGGDAQTAQARKGFVSEWRLFAAREHAWLDPDEIADTGDGQFLHTGRTRLASATVGEQQLTVGEASALLR